MKGKKVYCSVCGLPASHKKGNIYYCEKHYDKFANDSFNGFSPNLNPGGFIQLQNHGKVSHSWMGFGKKPRVAKKEKISRLVSSATITL